MTMSDPDEYDIHRDDEADRIADRVLEEMRAKGDAEREDGDLEDDPDLPLVEPGDPPGLEVP